MRVRVRVTILLTLRVRGHFVMSVTKNHESHYVTVLDDSQVGAARAAPLFCLIQSIRSLFSGVVVAVVLAYAPYSPGRTSSLGNKVCCISMLLT